MQVEVHFLGRPEIIINGEKMQIAQKKIEALVLYILFNENCTRDELAGMFWCDCSEDAAKRNLRNSLYKIRIELGEDFILTKGNSYVYINPELAVERDTDIFIMEDNEKKLLGLNNFNFMDKVYLKNCVEFEKWVLSVQNAYERVITQKLLAAMKNNLAKCKYNLAEKYARQVLALDKHQEEACCALMRIYEKEGDFNKAIQIYRKFSDDLQKELDIEPDTQTQETYGDILKKKQQRIASGYAETSSQKLLSALNGLLEEFSGFEKRESYKTCFLCGDFGMGKEKYWNLLQIMSQRQRFIPLNFLKSTGMLSITVYTGYWKN